jgi:hypothetical protein
MTILSVGESKPKKFKLFSALIKFVEQTDHTHSFVSWKDHRNGVRVVAEAKGGDCRIVTNNTFKDENEVVRIFQYKITEEQLIKFEQYVWTQMGRPYGFKHIFGLFLMRIGITKKNRFKDGDYSQICAELTIKAISHALGEMLPVGVEDYGLREAHAYNLHNLSLDRCSLAGPDKIARINEVST